MYFGRQATKLKKKKSILFIYSVEGKYEYGEDWVWYREWGLGKGLWGALQETVALQSDSCADSRYRRVGYVTENGQKYKYTC